MEKQHIPGLEKGSGIIKIDIPHTHLKKPQDLLKVSLVGSMAGTFMETLVHPLDTIRTRIKTNTLESVPFFTQASRMIKQEGIYSVFRGISCTLFCAALARGVYFYFYEKLKILFKGNHMMPVDLAPFAAGFIAGFIGDLIEVPSDLVRTRMQIGNTYDYKHVFDGYYKVYKDGGFRELYHGAKVYFTLDALDTGLTFGFYELSCKILSRYFKSEPDGVNYNLSVVSSSLAASASAILTNPIDVILARVQILSNTNAGNFRIRDLIKNTYKNEGIKGFYKGVGGRVWQNAISAVILFPTYEFLKHRFDIDLSEYE